MPDLNPLHYVIAGLAVALLVLGIAYTWQGKNLEVTQAKYDAFVADTNAAGLQAGIDNRKKEAALTDEILKIQGKYDAATNSLNSSYAEYDRLRKSKTNTGGRTVPSLAAAASGASCPDDEARLATSLEQLEAGVLERLAKSRDEAINLTIACQEYILELPRVLNPQR